MKTTYDSFISQFEITEKPAKIDGMHAHHIIPRTEQKNLGITDNRCVLLKYSEHGYAHWLYDKEHGTHTANLFLGRLKKTFKDITGYEDFLPLDSQIWVSEEHIQTLAMLNTGKEFSDETRQKISEKLKGNKNGLGHVVTEETRQAISKANKGRPSKNKGEHLSDETKEKLSQALMGNSNTLGMNWYSNGVINRRFRDEEEIPEGFTRGRTIKVWNKGLKDCYSEETLKKNSEAHKGEKNYWYGTHGPMYGKTAWNKGQKGVQEAWNKGITGCFSEASLEKMSKSQSGIRWWNNGVITVRSRECPGPDFIIGRLPFYKKAV